MDLHRLRKDRHILNVLRRFPSLAPARMLQATEVSTTAQPQTQVSGDIRGELNIPQSLKHYTGRI